MGDMGERFGIGVKVLLFCIVVWGAAFLIWEQIARLVDYLGIDHVTAACTIMLVFFVAGFWKLFLFFDRAEKAEKEKKHQKKLEREKRRQEKSVRRQDLQETKLLWADVQRSLKKRTGE